MDRGPCEEYSETARSMGRARVVELLQIQIQQTKIYSSIPSPLLDKIMGFHEPD